MKTEHGLRLPLIVPVLVLALLLNPFAYALPQEPSAGPGVNGLPDSPGSVETRSGSMQSDSTQSSPAQSGSVQSAQLAPSPAPSQTPPQAQPQPQPKEPLGTAAAETVPTMGIAASQPAGAALAPAKQRRVRTILIRVGAILAAGAAVGATVALSEGSPSKPPGAR